MEACKEATPTVGRGPNQRSSGVGWQESGRRQSGGGLLGSGGSWEQLPGSWPARLANPLTKGTGGTG